MQMLIKKLSERNAKILAILLTVLIAYLSLKSGGVDVKIPIKNIDKFFHFSAYFTLTLSWLYALKGKRAVLKIVILLILYGILLEFAQEWFTQDRTKDMFDALANTVGIIIAVFFSQIFFNNFKKNLVD